MDQHVWTTKPNPITNPVLRELVDRHQIHKHTSCCKVTGSKITAQKKEEILRQKAKKRKRGFHEVIRI
jgi:hypothetical protein